MTNQKELNGKTKSILEGYTKSELVDMLVDILPNDAKEEIITNFESQNPD